MQHLLSELLYIGIAVGYLAPEEHTHLTIIKGTTQLFHDSPSQGPAVSIVAIVALIPISISIKCRGCRQLNRTEHATINIALHFQYPLNEICIRSQHTHTPARHVMALAHRIELNAAILGSRYTENTQWVVVEDKAVGVVVDYHNIFILGQLHQSFI